MKTITEQLSTYKSVHLNKNNVTTHFFGVPLIILSIVILLSLVAIVFQSDSTGQEYRITAAMLVALIVVVYYFVLHIKLAVASIIILAPLFYLGHQLAATENPLILAITIFVIGWIIQFIGHWYEKAKPAFIDDINQLFIGPLFLISEVCFFLGMEKELADQVHEQAVEKRKTFNQKS